MPPRSRFAGEALRLLALALVPVVLLGELLDAWLVRVLATGFAPGSLQYGSRSSSAGSPSLICCSSRWPPCSAACCRRASASRRRRSRRSAQSRPDRGPAADPAPRALAAATCPGLGCRWPRASLQLAWVAVAAARAGLAPRSRMAATVARGAPPLAPDRPGVVGVGVVQLNLLVSSWFATHLPAGTVSYLFYADRLVQLPLGIVGVALGTALLPALSLARARRAGSRTECSTARSSWRCSWPCRRRSGSSCWPSRSCTSCSSAAPSTRRARRPRRCWPAWRWACRPMSWRKVLAPAFFAREDTRTPVRVAAVALVVERGGRRRCSTATLGHVGIALALSLVELGERAGPGRAAWPPRAAAARPAPARRGAAHLARGRGHGRVLLLARCRAEPGADGAGRW